MEYVAYYAMCVGFVLLVLLWLAIADNAELRKKLGETERALSQAVKARDAVRRAEACGRGGRVFADEG